MQMKNKDWYDKCKSSLIDGKELPETFQGYPTEELVNMLALIGSGNSLAGNSKEKILAMDQLSQDYHLAPVHQV